MSSLIRKVLESLTSRLLKQPVIIIQRTFGYTLEYTCTFTKPVAGTEIEEFQAETGYLLPEDYMYFLSLHNGAMLFRDIRGEDPHWNIFAVDEIEDALERYPTPDPIYVIAKFAETLICVNDDYVKQGRKDYLFDQSIYTCTHDNPEPIGLNFELWLDQLIAAQGDCFWSWKHMRPELLHDFDK